MTRDPFPDPAAFRRLEDIASGVYDPRPATDERLARRWTPAERLLVALLVFGELFLVASLAWLVFGGGR